MNILQTLLKGRAGRRRVVHAVVPTESFKDFPVLRTFWLPWFSVTWYTCSCTHRSRRPRKCRVITFNTRMENNLLMSCDDVLGCWCNGKRLVPRWRWHYLFLPQREEEQWQPLGCRFLLHPPASPGGLLPSRSGCRSSCPLHTGERADAGTSAERHKSPGVSAKGQSSSLERAARNLFSFTAFSFHASR